jgi:hypothetical protein
VASELRLGILGEEIMAGGSVDPIDLNRVSMAAEVAGGTERSSLTARTVHLVEEKVFAQFNDEVKKEIKRWFLDSGASNHMTGVREIFAEFDSNVHRMVKFGDGFVVEIEGIGTTLFVCKNGECRLLARVYLIPKLTTNITSLGQLDEIGYEIGIREGVMKVRDKNQELLARVERSSNRLSMCCRWKFLNRIVLWQRGRSVAVAFMVWTPKFPCAQDFGSIGDGEGTA